MAERQAVVPPQLAVRVICDQGHLLCGLFVVFRLKPRAAGEDPWANVARIMESTADPGEEPVDPNPPPPADPNAPPPPPPPKGRKPKAPPKPSKAQLAYRAKHAAWETQRAASQDTPPDPSTEFVAGFVDDAGYLVPVRAGSNPWFDPSAVADPDAYKLGLDEVYEACLLRHPDTALARAVARHLNNAATADDAKYGIESWGTLVRDIRVESHATDAGPQYVFKLTENASDYVPRGHSRYGEWNLYQDMPHMTCANVPSQVEKLANDLGKLRYPVSETQQPYVAAPLSELKTSIITRSLALRVEMAKKKVERKAPYFERNHRILGQFAAALGGFQEHVLARTAFALSHKDEAFGRTKKNSWFYLIGTPFAFDEGSTDVRAWRAPAYLFLGTADRVTGNMIEHWLDHGLRKPGEVMIETATTGLWMQQRAAIAVDSWSLLLGAMGVKYENGPLVGGSTFRRLVDDPHPGSIKNSLHCTGHAIDFSGGGRRQTIERWPIRLEADWLKNGIEVKESNEQLVNRGKLNYSLHFKLYAHSELDFFGSGSSAAFATLRQRLQTFPTDLVNRLKREVGSPADAAVDAIFQRATADAAALVRELLGAESSVIAARFFREHIRPFQANVYEEDAGTSGPVRRPHEAGEGLAGVRWAKSWVNISTLGWAFGMERIGAHQLDVREQEYVDELDSKKAKRAKWVSRPMMAYMKTAEEDIVSLLRMVSAPPSQAAENPYYDTPIKLLDAKKQLVATVAPADIERDFLSDWRAALAAEAKLRAKKKETASKAPKAVGAQMSIVLSAAPGKEDVVNRAAAILDRFGSQRFVAVSRGSSVAVPEHTVFAGAAIAAMVRAANTTFRAGVQARWAAANPDAARESEAADAATSAAASGGGTATKPKLTRAQSAARDQRDKHLAKEAARAAPDWTLVLQPIFVRGTVDPRAIPFSPGHSALLPGAPTANHLEWWHYQLRRYGANWGVAAAELGYSLAVLRTPRMGADGVAPMPHRGGGFSEKELASKPGNFASKGPSNVYVDLDGG